MYQRTLETLLKVQKEFGEMMRKRNEMSAETGEIGGLELKFPEIQITVTVVTQYEQIGEKAKAMGCQVLYNSRPEEGISSSLKIGLQGNKDAAACLFTVADQPWLYSETVASLLKCFLDSGKGIACAAGGGKLGNPCVFSSQYYEELLKLTGDVGGKRVIMAHREDTAVFEVKNISELQDVDRPLANEPHR